MRYLTVSNESDMWMRPNSVTMAAFKEIIKEMEFKMNPEFGLDPYHRDGHKIEGLGYMHNNLHPRMDEVEIKPLEVELST